MIWLFKVRWKENSTASYLNACCTADTINLNIPPSTYQQIALFVHMSDS